MSLARTRDVDMVLLAGDLFHDNKPSRKAMYHVMESLRRNCLGDKPCSLEILSDQSEHFSGYANDAAWREGMRYDFLTIVVQFVQPCQLRGP